MLTISFFFRLAFGLESGRGSSSESEGRKVFLSSAESKVGGGGGGGGGGGRREQYRQNQTQFAYDYLDQQFRTKFQYVQILNVVDYLCLL